MIAEAGTVDDLKSALLELPAKKCFLCRCGFIPVFEEKDGDNWLLVCDECRSTAFIKQTTFTGTCTFYWDSRVAGNLPPLTFEANVIGDRPQI